MQVNDRRKDSVEPTPIYFSYDDFDSNRQKELSQLVKKRLKNSHAISEERLKEKTPEFEFK